MLRGDKGNDWLYGDVGGDLFGRGLVELGDDTLEGGPGDDVLFGDFGGNDFVRDGAVRGDDTFVLRKQNGNDLIGDFEAGGTNDALDVSDFYFCNEQEVLDLAVQVEADTFIDLGSGTTVTLQNVDVNDLTTDDFLVV
jgi:hypothetical protein